MYYTETDLFFPYYHSFPQEIHELEDYACILRPTLSTESGVLDYDHGVEGDLFKAPETVIEDEEPLIGLDPTAAETSMISFGGEMIIASQDLHEQQDIESSLDFEQLLSEVFYECKKDILAKEETENSVFSEGLIRKSASTGCLGSMEKIPGVSELGYHGMDMEVVNGMRRVLSEGDLETLGKGRINRISPAEQQQIIINCNSEDRMEKLLRYRNKKAKRNFGRKIKYACRKTLADNQPRIRGRFAKTGN